MNILKAAPRPTHVPIYTPELFYRPPRQAKPAAPTTLVSSSSPSNQPKLIPELLPLKSVISSKEQCVPESSAKSKSKLRLVRPWEQRNKEGDGGGKNIEVVNIDEDYDDVEHHPERQEPPEQQQQEHVPLKKRRLIMYELDCNYAHIKFGNCL